MRKKKSEKVNKIEVRIINRDKDKSKEDTSSKSLLSDIESLGNNSITFDDDFILSDRIPKKTERKKKKKGDSLESLLDYDIDVGETLDLDKFIEEKEDYGFIKGLDEDEDDEYIIKEQKKNYSKLKRKGNYKKEFAEEITILYNLLDDIGKLSKGLESDYNNIRNAKVRGVSKYSNDLGNLVLNAKQQRLAITKEIVNVKKTIADLELKREKANENKESTNENSPELQAAAYLKSILNNGRQSFIDTMTTRGYNDSADIDDFNADPYQGYDDEDKMEIYHDEINNILEESNYRSRDVDKYIEHENDEVSICIKRCIDNGEYEFVAIDKNGTQIYDYPVPDRESVGRLKFSQDGRYATDSRQLMYKVIEYYLPDEDE